MRVIVVDARRMVGRDLVLVLEALAGHDAEEDVVGVVGGGDVEPVHVEVRVARGLVLSAGVPPSRGRTDERAVRRQPVRQFVQLVDQVDAQRVSRADAQRRAGEGALVDGHDRRPSRHRHRHHTRLESGVEQAVAAGADLGLDQLLARGGAAEVEPGQDQAPARHADGGDPGAGRQLHEVPPSDHVLVCEPVGCGLACVRDEWMWRLVHGTFPSGFARPTAWRGSSRSAVSAIGGETPPLRLAGGPPRCPPCRDGSRSA